MHESFGSFIVMRRGHTNSDLPAESCFRLIDMDGGKAGSKQTTIRPLNVTTKASKTSAKSPGEPGGTQAIERAVSILFAFSPDRPSLRIPDLAAELGLNKSTLYRLLHALSAVNLVRRDEDTGEYGLGPAVLDLASCFLSTLDLGVNARPFLEALAAECGETVNLALLDGSDVIRVDNVKGSKTPQLVSQWGLRMPVYCSASGKALLLDHSEEQIKQIFLGSQPKARTGHTIVDANEFVRRMAQWREQGWTLNDEESEVGIRVIGAPIRDFSGSIVASVSVSAPAFRLDEKAIPALAKSVLACAQEISGSMGAHTSKPKSRRLIPKY